MVVKAADEKNVKVLFAMRGPEGGL